MKLFAIADASEKHSFRDKITDAQLTCFYFLILYLIFKLYLHITPN